MNEIDQILSNIDKDDDDNLFPQNQPESPKNDEIANLIDSIDTSAADAEARKQTAEPKLNLADTRPEVAAPDSAYATDSAAVSELNEMGIFTLKGSKSWNRHEPYLIHIERSILKIDIESLHKSFYFVDEPSDQAAIKLKIKQEIVAYLRKPKEHVSDRYREFIYRIIITATQELIRAFNLDSGNEKLFLYHIGPLTAFRYIREVFNHNKYGYCYKYLPGNKAVRFFPEEFIKEAILKWFEENINTLDLPFDSIQKFDEIKKIVLLKYHADFRLFNARLEQINAQAGHEKNISRHKLFYLKGVEWFGLMNIEIYKRFIGNNIFM
jgi:hypothetical protein